EMEGMYVAKTLKLKKERAARMGLWSGEEPGLLGWRAYVKEHFADPATMKPTAEHEKFAGYFNIDNGTGKIRGIYLQGNEMCRPIFEKWLEAFKDLGAATITNRNTGGTDHQAFDVVGHPGSRPQPERHRSPAAPSESSRCPASRCRRTEFVRHRRRPCRISRGRKRVWRGEHRRRFREWRSFRCRWPIPARRRSRSWRTA